MCLAVPGRVKSIDGSLARVDFRGVERLVNIQLVPDVVVGQFVLVHAGFAIQTIAEGRAAETIALFDQVDAMIESEDEAR